VGAERGGPTASGSRGAGDSADREPIRHRADPVDERACVRGGSTRATRRQRRRRRASDARRGVD
jgi:hypothetical protein